jgi:hypothetical protein
LKTYFKKSEFYCDGESCYDKMNKAFLEKLDLARSYSSVKYVISSSWRSMAYTIKKKWSKTSSHLIGMAVDIEAKTSSEKWEIVRTLMKAGFTRIGVGLDFIHVDMDYNKPQELLWTY